MTEVSGPPPAPKPPVTTTTSIWPAAAILGLAVVMLGVFLLVDFVTSKGVVPPPTTLPAIVGGLTRDATPTPALQYCLQSEEVPTNIDSAFVVPDNTVPRSGASTPDLRGPASTTASNRCRRPAPLLDRSSRSSTPSSARAAGASSSKGASNGDPQSLFQKAGSDGFYWEIGVTVTKSTASHVDWKFEIYQNSDTV